MKLNLLLFFISDIRFKQHIDDMSSYVSFTSSRRTLYQCEAPLKTRHYGLFLAGIKCTILLNIKLYLFHIVLCDIGRSSIPIKVNIHNDPWEWKMVDFLENFQIMIVGFVVGLTLDYYEVLAWIPLVELNRINFFFFHKFHTDIHILLGFISGIHFTTISISNHS